MLTEQWQIQKRPQYLEVRTDSVNVIENRQL
jgi:hypothetical protein